MVENSSESERISAYLRQELDAGYDIATIRNYLLSQGYPVDLVDASIDKLYTKEKRSITLPFSLSFLQNKVVLLSLLALVLVGIGMTLYLFIGEDERNGSPITTTGSGKNPTADLANNTTLGNGKNQGNSETNYLSSTGSQESEKKDTDQEKMNNDPNITIDTTERSDSTTITQYTLEAEIAKFNNADDAQDFCNKKDVVKDDCYATVAAQFEQPELCREVSTTIKKENCILELAWSEKGYAFCGDINDARKQNLCRNIAGVRSRDLSNNLAFETGQGNSAYRNATAEEIADQNASITYRAIEGGIIVVTK